MNDGEIERNCILLYLNDQADLNAKRALEAAGTWGKRDQVVHYSICSAALRDAADCIGKGYHRR